MIKTQSRFIEFEFLPCFKASKLAAGIPDYPLVGYRITYDTLNINPPKIKNCRPGRMLKADYLHIINSLLNEIVNK
jgi:hypothetical protein